MLDPESEELISTLAQDLAQWSSQTAGVCIVGINGAQGSGKSTLAARLESVLRVRHGLRAAVLSIDDIYLTKAERQTLGKNVHPLCATRGVPGTHDVTLGLDTLVALKNASAGTETPLPRFDKLSDDRRPPSAWPVFTGPPDFILFEGWCIAAPPQEEAALHSPVNGLEAREDPAGVWRRWSNDYLSTEYQELWRHIDRLVMIQVPDLTFVVDQRLRQERELAAADPSAKAMARADVERFVAHYERLTRHMWATLPDHADVLVSRGPQGFRNLRLRAG